MSKELPFFKFEPAQWVMGKIQRCSLSAKGAYIDLCSRYWNNECKMSLEDAELDCGEDQINELIKKKIISVEDEFISIDFLDIQLSECAKVSEAKSNAAKKRWKVKNNSSNSDAMHVHKSALQNDADKIREDKRREDKRREEFIKIKNEFLNSHTWIQSCAKMYKWKQDKLTAKIDHILEELYLKDLHLRDVKENKSHIVNIIRGGDPESVKSDYTPPKIHG